MRQRRKVRGSGKLDNPLEGDAEGAKVRGNPEFHLRQSRKMQDAGKPEASSTGDPGGAETRGNPGIPQPVPLKDAKFEETRRSIAGTA
jgi:hypothetical protein